MTRCQGKKLHNFVKTRGMIFFYIILDLQHQFSGLYLHYVYTGHKSMQNKRKQTVTIILTQMKQVTEVSMDKK